MSITEFLFIITTINGQWDVFKVDNSWGFVIISLIYNVRVCKLGIFAQGSLFYFDFSVGILAVVIMAGRGQRSNGSNGPNQGKICQFKLVLLGTFLVGCA